MRPLQQELLPAFPASWSCISPLQRCLAREKFIFSSTKEDSRQADWRKRKQRRARRIWQTSMERMCCHDSNCPAALAQLWALCCSEPAVLPLDVCVGM